MRHHSKEEEACCVNGSKEEQGMKKKQGRRMCEKGEATKEQVCEEDKSRGKKNGICSTKGRGGN